MIQRGREYISHANKSRALIERGLVVDSALIERRPTYVDLLTGNYCGDWRVGFRVADNLPKTEVCSLFRGRVSSARLLRA